MSSPRGVETLRYSAGALDLLDQRLLPQTIRYVTCRDAAETAAAIRDMVVRGAPAIGCAAAYGVALEAGRLAEGDGRTFASGLEAGFAVLRASRPTAVNLFWALDRMRAAWATVRESVPPAIAARLADEAEQLFREDLRVNQAIGRHGAALIPEGARVMTHCNAGALATAGHGTALGVIRSARDAGKRLSVIANETRPYLQGARLTAWEMVQEEIPVTLITDNMAGHLMRTGRVDVVIVGADRIAANGDTANKIGTYTLAVLAARHGLPFYVAAPISTIDLAIPDGSGIPIEERDPSEVTGFRDLRWAPEGVAVANPAFDVTPAELVTAIVTEKGAVRAPYSAALRALFR
ncbi:MAG: S-methyl-5-thioribose-1-phosphate isomerase [Burkholderiales bacterium]|jgi:methylthioribose-1-phosphate isomerase|nr:S-methyl-5-thioribose-1-phosphate isomerase [Burkholderiales bacterium]